MSSNITHEEIGNIEKIVRIVFNIVLPGRIILFRSKLKMAKTKEIILLPRRRRFYQLM